MGTVAHTLVELDETDRESTRAVARLVMATTSRLGSVVYCLLRVQLCLRPHHAAMVRSAASFPMGDRTSIDLVGKETGPW